MNFSTSFPQRWDFCQKKLPFSVTQSLVTGKYPWGMVSDETDSCIILALLLTPLTSYQEGRLSLKSKSQYFINPTSIEPLNIDKDGVRPF